MQCHACNAPAGPGDDYCPDCRAAIDHFRQAIDAGVDCTACGRPADVDGLCRGCFDDVCASIVAADNTLPPGQRGGGRW